LEAARAQAQEVGIDLKIIMRPGHPAKTIVLVAKEGKFDLVLVGNSGLSGVWAAFLGTTAEKVSRHAPCSVLIVR
jgi:nucleotide-binding universal stress UspA family protein